MIRFWFEFMRNEEIPAAIKIGCGITANNYQDALVILKEKFFTLKELPNSFKVIENIDVTMLDVNHVLPNMLPPINRGVWFPIGYDW